jgi:hypothetical protein
VAFQFLDDVPCLQVPEVDTIVLGATHDILPVRDRESCEYAEFAVRMSLVRFQKLARGVTP